MTVEKRATLFMAFLGFDEVCVSTDYIAPDGHRLACGSVFVKGPKGKSGSNIC
jgi:hypothetical protein